VCAVTYLFLFFLLPSPLPAKLYFVLPGGSKSKGRDDRIRPQLSLGEGAGYGWGTGRGGGGCESDLTSVPIGKCR
jgi:hypothetical protein